VPSAEEANHEVQVAQTASGLGKAAQGNSAKRPSAVSTLLMEQAKCGLFAQVKFSSAKGALKKNHVLASQQVSTMREEQARSLAIYILIF
jgi:hypothetical protein